MVIVIWNCSESTFCVVEATEMRGRVLAKMAAARATGLRVPKLSRYAQPAEPHATSRTFHVTAPTRITGRRPGQRYNPVDLGIRANKACRKLALLVPLRMIERGYDRVNPVHLGGCPGIALPSGLSIGIVDCPVLTVYAIFLFDRQEFLFVWREQDSMPSMHRPPSPIEQKLSGV